MAEVKLLDCTLRDGGYVNEWRFGNGPITCIFNRLNESGIEMIEVGFLDDRQPFDIDRTIQPTSQALDRVYENTLPKKVTVVAMIDYGTCDIDNVCPKSESWVDGIRLIFKKENMYRAIEYGKQLMAKGYLLFLQMVSITAYADVDVKSFTAEVNKINPYAVSIVDTYGIMHKDQALYYFDLLDKNLNKDILIGYHSHNNLQLAYSNTIEFVNHNVNRDLIVDGTLYGMGKNAGNAPIELLALYLNNNYRKNYDIDQLLESISNEIIDIQMKSGWGYNIVFYLSSKCICHPNYVKFLMSLGTLSVKSINAILDAIEPDFKLHYNKSYISKKYREYIQEFIKDEEDREKLVDELSGNDLLLIGPGKSLKNNTSAIEKYRKDNNVITISVNIVPVEIKTDYLFINNSKRYSLLAPYINNNHIKIITTSKITTVGKKSDFVINYESLARDNLFKNDNALSMILDILEYSDVRSLALAGFDGFSEDLSENYIDESYDRSDSPEYYKSINATLKEKIKDFSRNIPIKFITKSKYW